MVAQLRARLVAISWRDLITTLGPVLVLSIAGIWFAVRFVRPAPPDIVTMTSGPDGSMFRIAADKYRSILARNGVTLKILPSQGSLENLQRLRSFIRGGYRVCPRWHFGRCSKGTSDVVGQRFL
jgi:hypothetical protein